MTLKKPLRARSRLAPRKQLLQTQTGYQHVAEGLLAEKALPGHGTMLRKQTVRRNFRIWQ